MICVRKEDEPDFNFHREETWKVGRGGREAGQGAWRAAGVCLRVYQYQIYSVPTTPLPDTLTALGVLFYRLDCVAHPRGGRRSGL